MKNIFFLSILLLFCVSLFGQSSWQYFGGNQFVGQTISETDEDIWYNVGLKMVKTNKSTGVHEIFEDLYQFIENTNYQHKIFDSKIDNNGDLWLGTSFGLVHYDYDTWECYKPTTNPYFYVVLVNDKIYAIDIDENNDIWVGTNHGLAKFSDGSWYSYFTEISGMYQENVNDVEVVNADSVFLFLRGGYLACYNNGSYTLYPDFDMMSYCNNIALDDNDNIWLSSNTSGLFKYNLSTNAYEHFNQSNSTLLSDTINNIYLDSNGVLWVATANGINSIDGLNWDGYSSSTSNLPNVAVNNVYVGADYVVYAGMLNKGLSQFDGNSWITNYDFQSDLPCENISYILHDGDDIYALSELGLLYFNNTEWELFSPQPWFNQHNEDFIHLDTLDNLWVFSLAGISKWNGDFWINNYGSFDFYTPMNLSVDSLGNIWFVDALSMEEFCKFNPYTNQITIEAPLDNEVINDYVLDTLGNIYASFDYNVHYFDGNEWTVVPGAQTLMYQGDGEFDFFVDPQNRLWIQKGNQLFVYLDDNWIEYAYSNVFNNMLDCEMRPENTILFYNQESVYFTDSLHWGQLNIPPEYSQETYTINWYNDKLFFENSESILIYDGEMPFNLKTLHGQITSSENENLNNADIQVIKHNNVTNELTEVLHSKTDSNGNYSFHFLDSAFYIYCQPDTLSFANEMPLYAQNALTFQNADNFYFSTDSLIVNLQTYSQQDTTGNGIIGGTINQEGGGKESLTTVSGLKLLLVNGLGEVIRYTQTNTNGTFQFENLNHDTYTIWVDKPLIDNSLAPEITLDSETPEIINASFVLHETYLELTNLFTLSDQYVKTNISIYPNPCSKDLYLSCEEAIKRIQITDVKGSLIDKIEINQKYYHYSFQNITAGIYYVRITTVNGRLVKRKLIKQ